MGTKQKGTMRNDPSQLIHDMEWNEFEAQLSRSARGGRSRTASGQALRDHFGPEKLERLQHLAEGVRSARQKRSRCGQYYLHPRDYGLGIDRD